MDHVTFLFIQSPLPLREFIDYVDHEQSPEDLAEVERIAGEARAHWWMSKVFDSIIERSNLAMQEEEELRRKYEAACKQSEEETRRHVEELRCREREASETERDSMRERARRAKESGEAGLRKGKYPRCTQ